MALNSRLASVVDQTTGTTVASSISYNPAGEITSRTLGSGVIEIRHRPSSGVLKTGRWTHSTHRSKHLIPVSVPIAEALRIAWFDWAAVWEAPLSCQCLFAAIWLPKIRFRWVSEARREAIAGAALLPGTKSAELFGPKTFSCEAGPSHTRIAGASTDG